MSNYPIQQMLQANRYHQVGLAKNDIKNVMMHYPDLKPTVESFTMNGPKRNLLCLTGTIPVSYRGSTYNIPLSIHLMENHPSAGPICMVKPTLSMSVKPGKHVDANGRIYLPYLSAWRQGTHELTGLVQILSIEFGEQPPVVSNAPQQRRPAPYPGSTPSYPHATAGYQPRGPPSTTYQPSNTTPYPVGPTNPPYPGNTPSGYPQSTPYPSYPGAMPYPPVPGQQNNQMTPYPNPVNVPGQNSISDDMIKASLKSAVNDKLKRRMREAHSQADSEMSVLKQTEKDLRAGQAKIKGIIENLESETNQVDLNITILESKNKEMEEKIETMQNKQEELDVDDVVLPTAPLYKQILESFAEEQALEDTIYYLGEGLRKGSVDLDVFLKHVRSLARQQFVLRAIVKKARTTAGLANI